jgi:hypothetical protein
VGREEIETAHGEPRSLKIGLLLHSQDDLLHYTLLIATIITLPIVRFVFNRDVLNTSSKASLG